MISISTKSSKRIGFWFNKRDYNIFDSKLHFILCSINKIYCSVSWLSNLILIFTFFLLNVRWLTALCGLFYCTEEDEIFTILLRNKTWTSLLVLRSKEWKNQPLKKRKSKKYLFENFSSLKENKVNFLSILPRTCICFSFF